MSRSRKKIGCWKLKDGWYKRYANKKVRKYSDVPNGKAYRKIEDSWNIVDYVFRERSKDKYPKLWRK